jgi:2-C-methyl-D-erythritol 2,4-cyclodiphosphate synthase
MAPFRIGHGYDVHKFSETAKPLYLAGLEIDPSMGVEAHSDGDVLLHALCDALLGAAALRDIGYHFPDTNSAFKNKNSSFFVTNILEKLKDQHYAIGNVDVTVVAQQPKLSKFIPQMIDNLAKLLLLDKSSVNIKATTTEKLGFVGRKEGIASHVVVLLYKIT